MNTHFGIAAAVAVLAAAPAPQAMAQQNLSPAARVAIDDDDIGGVVASRFGPEAGVWVIAETKELGTRFARMVVTDDLGRFVIPDLPRAHYDVWVRGYGLVDSAKIASEPGRTLNLTAETAPNRAAAAQYYPPIYWLSLLKIPDRSRFPGTGPNGNGIPVQFKTQDQWLDVIKTNGCNGCHQLGNYATRTVPQALGHFDSGVAAWARRLQSGPGGNAMVTTMGRLLTPDGGHLAALADWTDRIRTGELPNAAPPRPTGVERNLVVTVRDWLDAKHYLHDLAATDKRQPTVNANGPMYGSTELSTNEMPILDPVHKTKSTVTMPVRDPEDVPSSAQANALFAPSPYWGNEQVWDSQSNAHTPVMDRQGRVYFAAQTRSPKDPPAYCGGNSALRSAQLFPLPQKPDGFVQNARQVTVYDPATKNVHRYLLRHVSTLPKTRTTRSGSPTTPKARLRSSAG